MHDVYLYLLLLHACKLLETNQIHIGVLNNIQIYTV